MGMGWTVEGSDSRGLCYYNVSRLMLLKVIWKGYVRLQQTLGKAFRLKSPLCGALFRTEQIACSACHLHRSE